MPGSLVSTRSSFCAASSVPSATLTCPAWMDRPMPTPPPWWIDTQVAPLAGLTRALSSGQSARGAGGAGGGGSPADDDRRPDPPRCHQLVEPQACPVALALAEPADAGRQAL